ncbi:hypothetical protein ACPOL_4733 [Acidisarcina polymorpha]|uniref:Uncharacterized protein n=1 Tax=Acidisarcina polymorpha TaxID=2211140 RepID=A0A2Z5G4K1_9BACT|nr:hypothetical protein ACPOL_4733 [Acidisarcina polymorpha]
MAKVELIHRGSGYKIWFATGELKGAGHLKWFGGDITCQLFRIMHAFNRDDS